MKTSVAYLTMLCCYVYYVDDSKKQENSDTQHIQAYTYEYGSPVGMNVTTTTGPSSNPTVTTAQYYFIKNLQGDIVAMADATGTIKCSYTYNSWGKVLSIAGPNGTPSLTDHTNPANINPFRYRGYYYDAENQLYWLQSRFYDPNTGRFLNADSQLNLKDGFTGTNLFTYCGNNPIMFIDPTGHMPEWLQGTLNFIGGVAETAVGVGLGITAGWTGFGAVAAAFLIADGAARATQGIAQIVNDIAGSTILPEEHIIKAAFQDVGYSIAGDTGADIAGGAYDLAAVAANIYVGRVELQQIGFLPVKVKTSSLIPDPANPMTSSGINYWTKTLSQNGFKGYNSLPNAYGVVEPICVQKGTMIIANGHHRIYVLSKYGVETVKVFLVP